VDRKLSQGASGDGALELLGSLAILRRREVRPSALRLPDKYCQYSKGGAQHFSRQPNRSPRFLAATCMAALGRKASTRVGTNAHCGVVIRVVAATKPPLVISQSRALS